MYRNILFDLDGTLSDPKVGICTSVQYALGKYGIVEDDIDKLEPFIGPPLRDSFRKFYNIEESRVEEVIGYYRERFKDIGIFENEIYPGIPELLRDLKKRGHRIALASSKPQVFVERILDHFEIRSYFDVVVGSELDGKRESKEEVIQYTLQQLFPDGEIDYDDSVMVGDRKFDIEAALKCGIMNIGVAYGYGSREELEEAGAAKVVNSVAGLRAVLLPMMGSAYPSTYAPKDNASNTDGKTTANGGTRDWKTESRNTGKQSFANMWGMIGPVLIYWVGTNFATIALIIATNALLSYLGDATLEAVRPYAHEVSAVITTLATVIAVLFLGKQLKNQLNYEKEKNPAQIDNKWLQIVIMGASTIALSLGMNIWVSISGITAASETYQASLDEKYIVPIWLGILLYGIITPVAEEIVYRGLMYNRARRFMKRGMAILFTAFLFGFVHGDAVAGFYALVIGAVITYFYSRYHSLIFAIVLHALANIVVYTFAYYDNLEKLVTNNVACYVLCLLGIAGVAFAIIYDKKKAPVTEAVKEKK